MLPHTLRSPAWALRMRSFLSWLLQHTDKLEEEMHMKPATIKGLDGQLPPTPTASGTPRGLVRDSAELTEVGRKVLEVEAESLRVGAGRLDGSFARALDVILNSGAKLIVAGLGK